MISLWGRYYYFNNEKIKTIDIDLMNYVSGSSEYFGSRVGS